MVVLAARELVVVSIVQKHLNGNKRTFLESPDLIAFLKQICQLNLINILMVLKYNWNKITT